MMANAYSIRVRGVVQGVGFRPFVYRLACANTLMGWVLNAEEGVEIHLEGAETGLAAFVRDLKTQTPAAASIAEIDVQPAEPVGMREFTIRMSQRRERPTVRISPDLPVCDDCLRELFDPADARFWYPYINCTNCGPRYTVVRALPYDRPNTTMKDWLLDDYCTAEYCDPGNRRFHAQPVACPACGPIYCFLPQPHSSLPSDNHGTPTRSADIRQAAESLQAGAILAVKGLGGYHLVCDARNPASVEALRDRKYRKEKPFALMVRNVEMARTLVELSSDAEQLLTSVARPIVLAPARIELEGVAPDNNELGLMLPYTPLHHLLFAAGAPEILVMTSANRSSEPIAYEDEDALQRLAGIADSFLIGQRPIARRVDDSVARAGAFGQVVLRLKSGSRIHGRRARYGQEKLFGRRGLFTRRRNFSAVQLVVALLDLVFQVAVDSERLRVVSFSDIRLANCDARLREIREPSSAPRPVIEPSGDGKRSLIARGSGRKIPRFEKDIAAVA